MEVERLYGDVTAGFLHRMCKGVHDVARCEECEKYDGGKCRNVVMYEKVEKERGDDSSRPD
jgi:hypothetical protein